MNNKQRVIPTVVVNTDGTVYSNTKNIIVIYDGLYMVVTKSVKGAKSAIHQAESYKAGSAEVM